MTKKKCIKYLKYLADKIDKNDFYEYQAEGNTIINCIKTLESLGK